MRAMLDELASRALASGDGFLEDAWLDVLAMSGPGGVLTRWAAASPSLIELPNGCRKCFSIQDGQAINLEDEDDRREVRRTVA